MKVRRLQPVVQENLSFVKDRLEMYLPHSMTMYCLVELGIDYDLLRKMDRTLYIAEEQPESSLVVATPGCSSEQFQSLMIFWNPEIDSDNDVIELLSTLPDFSWKEPVFFYVSWTPLLRRIEAIMQHKSLGGGRLQCHRLSEGHVYTIASEDMIPNKSTGLEGHVLQMPLRVEDMEFVHSNWKKKHNETCHGLKCLVSLLPSLAIYNGQVKEDVIPIDPVTESDPNDAVNKELSWCSDDMEVNLLEKLEAVKIGTEVTLSPVAWTMQYHYGAIGNTFTVPAFRRRGLARVITLEMSTRFLDEGRAAYVLIDEKNLESIGMHQAMGFRRQAGVGWHLYLPKDAAIGDYITC